MESIHRKCKLCGKELGIFECHSIPITIDPTPSFPIPSGGVDTYCEKCYKGLSSLNLPKDDEGG